MSDFSILHAPLSVSDIKTVLGSSSNDVGTLCTHPNINMWAKFKPLRVNKTSSLTQKDREDAHYGLSMTVNTNTPMVQFVSGGGLNIAENTWSYVKPNSCYRMGDFLPVKDDGTVSADDSGYNHNAVAPTQIAFQNVMEFDDVAAGDTIVFAASLAPNDYWDRLTCLSLSDAFGGTLTAMSEYYITLGLYMNNGKQVVFLQKSSDMKIKDFVATPVVTNITMNLSNLPTDMRKQGAQIYAVMFASRDKFVETASQSTPGGGTYAMLNFAIGSDRKLFTMQMKEWFKGLTFTITQRPTITFTSTSTQYVCTITGSLKVQVVATSAYNENTSQMWCMFTGSNEQGQQTQIGSTVQYWERLAGKTKVAEFTIPVNFKKNVNKPSGALVFRTLFMRGTTTEGQPLPTESQSSVVRLAISTTYSIINGVGSWS